jgi:hypothetical protein
MSQFNDPYASPPPSPEQGKSGFPTWAKVLLIFGVLGGLSFVCCCGGMFFAGRYFMKTEPQAVRAMANDIITMQIDPGWNGTVGLNMWFMRMVFFEMNDGDGVLVLTDAEESAFQDRDQFEREMRAQMSQQLNKQHNIEAVNVVKSGERTYRVRGNETNFHFNQCEGVVSKQPYIEVSGVVDGNERPACIYVRVKEGTLSEGQIQEMIESIE